MDLSDPTSRTRGHLVVATPVLDDPNFDRTVVFVVEHTDEGALGVVLNRPSDTAIDESFGHLATLASEPPMLFVGGPVSLDAAVCLARVDSALTDATRPRGFQPLLGATGTLDLEQYLDGVPLGVEALRVFVGYAGWGAGQLEDEREAGAWYAVPALEDDLLTGDPATLWRRVLKRQGGYLAIASTYPRHPWLN